MRQPVSRRRSTSGERGLSGADLRGGLAVQGRIADDPPEFALSRLHCLDPLRQLRQFPPLAVAQARCQIGRFDIPAERVESR